MPTLYRKYRPSVFSDVTGQDTIVQTLQNEITMQRLAHAYLFSGPRGVGKTTLARLFAKAINCQKRKPNDFEPCNDCSSCNQINDGRHIDIVEIDAASQTGVDNVRENIIENAGVLPTSLKYKVFIIDEVHMLSTSAFNALLKTLEEPPAHVVFILATTELHKLPATVISRCERFSFKKIAFDKMVERLKKICKDEKVKIEAEVIERIARKSEGGLRDAESLLGQILSLDLKEVTTEDIQMVLPLSSSESIVEYIENIIAGEPGASIMLVNRQAEDGVNLDQFAYDLIDMLRAMLLLQMNADKNTISADLSEETIKKLRKMAGVGEHHLVSFLDMAIRRRSEIRSSPLPQLPLELLAVEAAELFSKGSGGSGDNLSQPVIHTTAEEKPTSKQPEPTKITKEEPKPVVAETAKETPASITPAPSKGSAKTTLEEVRKRWGEVTVKASTSIASLSFILSMCNVQEMEGNTLIVTVPYALHKEKLETSKNRLVIEQSLEQIFSEKLRLSYIIVQPEQPKSTDSDVAALAAEFGGEVLG